MTIQLSMQGITYNVEEGKKNTRRIYVNPKLFWRQVLDRAVCMVLQTGPIKNIGTQVMQCATGSGQSYLFLCMHSFDHLLTSYLN